ncbi:MAG: Uma2 family endonuclease [Chloroflexota bacterium]
MVSPAHRLTYEDYLRMPEDGHRYEIIDGELFVSPSPSIRHQVAAMNLCLALTQYVRANSLGRVFIAPCAVRLTPDEPVEPDLFFISWEREHIIGEQAVNGPPDLIVEILSPSGVGRDRFTKFNRYAQVGVAEYWIIDPASETIEQYVLEEGQYVELAPHGDGTQGSRVIPGLRLSVTELFVA